MRICEIKAAERRADALKVSAAAAKAKAKELEAQAELATGQMKQHELDGKRQASRRTTPQTIKPIGSQ